MKPLLTVLIAAMTLTVSGQDKIHSVKHLKKSDPNVLHFSTYVDDDCPGTEESFEDLVEDLLLKARIKRKGAWDYFEPVMLAKVECATDPSNKRATAFLIEVFFAVNTPALDPGPDEFPFERLRYDSKVHRALEVMAGTTPEEVESRLRITLGLAVMLARADYLKANFTE